MQGFLKIDEGFDTRKHQIERRKLKKKQKTAKGINE